MGGMSPGSFSLPSGGPSLGSLSLGNPLSGFNIPTFGGGFQGGSFQNGASRLPAGGGLAAGLPSTFATNFGAPAGLQRAPAFGGPAASPLSPYQAAQASPFSGLAQANNPMVTGNVQNPAQLMLARAQALGINPATLLNNGTISQADLMGQGAAAGFTPDQISAAIAKLQAGPYGGLLGA